MLTGEEISGEKAVSFGFADYLVESSRIPLLLQELSHLTEVSAIKSLIEQRYAVKTVAKFAEERRMFRNLFENKTSFTAVRENLEILKKSTHFSPE
jgi:enoyl-CoA hydratase/carnithine racemase